MERLHSGWLVKSPPESRTLGPWKFFKPKWRKRYFVLYTPPSAQSIPGLYSALLCYYNDERLSREYGRIDLNRCEEILTRLESDEHQFVSALRIVDIKGRERTYYLAADTEADMDQWADYLCGVLRLSGSGLDGFHSFPSPSFTATLPRRCSVLTQKTGEQRLLSNVPSTISKSAVALNIRMAVEQMQAPISSSGTVGTTPIGIKSTQKNPKIGKRQSILSMVVKPAVKPIRRPSCPVFQPQNIIINHHHQQKPTISASLGSNDNFVSSSPLLSDLPPFSDGHGYHNITISRWTADSCSPPALPSRVSRNPSNVSNSSRIMKMSVPVWSDVKGKGQRLEDPCHSFENKESPVKPMWRDSDFLDEEECDEDDRDPDYDHPNLIYTNDGLIGSLNDVETESTSNSKRSSTSEDNYHYPPFCYDPDSNAALDLPDLRRHPPSSILEETNRTSRDSNYDYLPGCERFLEKNRRRRSDREGRSSSSYLMSSSGGDDQSTIDDREGGLYDTLPIRNDSSPGEESSNRMSGIDSSTTIVNNSAFYQNQLPQIIQFSSSASGNRQLPPSGDDGTNKRDSHVDEIPSLPDKKCTGIQQNLLERKPAAAAPPTLLLPPVAPSRDKEVPHQINDSSYYVNVSKRSSVNSDGSQEGVYLLMSGTKKVTSVYTVMHSPEEKGPVFQPDLFSNSNETDDLYQLPDNSNNRPEKEDERPSYGNFDVSQFPLRHSSLSPIRFTPNTRSFKRKATNRNDLTLKVKTPDCSSNQKENHEPSSPLDRPPPLPPKMSSPLTYITYATLNLDEDAATGDRRLSSPLSDPATSPRLFHYHQQQQQQSDTPYRLIDPEKTKALFDLRKQIDDKHRSFNASP